MTSQVLDRNTSIGEVPTGSRSPEPCPSQGREATTTAPWRRRRWVQWLPVRWQQSLRRIYYGWQIRTGRFHSDEVEYQSLNRLVRPGSTAIDIGANLGTYTLRLAELVGGQGRVFAFEPVSETFEILTSNVRAANVENVTLFNMAASEECGFAELIVPDQMGFAAHYFARTAPAAADSERTVFQCALDALRIPGPVSLVKIDVEGHEASVLKGMLDLIARDRPVLIIEGDDLEVEELLMPLGYAWRRMSDSQNRLFAQPAVLELECGPQPVLTA